MFLVLLPPSPVRFLVLLFIVSILVAVGALNEEGGALLTFKGHVKKDSRGSFSNWNSSDPSPCTWNGITCKGERVIALTMPKQKLLGSLHPALGYLPHLRHVNLRSNRLYGNLPPELFRNSGLRSLVLSGNFLSGSLPSDIGKLSYLQILDVSQNLLNGSIPVSLLKCKRLRALDLSNNSFTGPLPTGIGNNLIALEKLDLSYNQFNGPVPGDIGSLVNLQGTVDLSHNGFSGSIPASLGNLPEMVYIDLSYNNLSGPIPQHGALVNRGPTAFIGNPGLCGPPLKNLCPSDVPASSPSLPFFLPSNYSPSGMGIGTLVRNGGRRGLSTGAVIAIVASDVLGICVISLLFLYCYHKATCARLKEDSGNSEKIQKISGSKECFCFRKDESGSPSENAEQLDLIPLDRHINFDLDELLKASAFVLGKSGIGIAYKVVLEDGLTLAVRRLGEGGSQRFKEFQAEVEAIAKVKHPNIVGLRAYYWTIDEKLLIYEYIPHGNLSTAIHGMVPFSPMTWLVRVNIMRGVAKGLAFLHEFSLKKYVHGDLKPSNILLGVDLEPHISNFGLARLANIAGGSPLQQSNRIASEKPQSHSLDVGMSPLTNTAFCYHAPEAFKTLKPSQKWDVYSYGVILLELITGRPPIVRLGNTEMDLVRWVELCIEEKKSLSQVLDPYLVQEAEEEEQIIAVLKVALACVQMNPDRRPSMRNVLETLERF